MEPPTTHHHQASQSYHILVVDDHEDTRDMLRALFEALNFEVIEAVDGDMALDVARESRPDLILMDAGLPVMDGISATRMIRSDLVIGNVPIVFLSGHALPKAQAEALAAGANDYLVKPIDLDRMLTVVGRHLPVLATRIRHRPREVH